MDNFAAVAKVHRAPKSGSKAEKKKRVDKKKRGLDENPNKGKNPRAFSNASKVGKGKKAVQRNADRGHLKEYVPQKNRMQDDAPPPVVVVVMGPPGSGKSTLIRSLVKKYTKQNIHEVKGPITVVTGKNRRVTFFECPNDLTGMTDLAKVADLAVLMVDASFGFEMETFEFLNIMQLHGFPKVCGVLTHLDTFRHGKALKNTKKRLKHRFWTEIYDGAKLFNMSGLQHFKYPKMEIHNLCLFISRTKFRPLTWRNTHPYLLVDRFEDMTHPDDIQRDAGCDRKLALFGYVRGCHLRPDAKIHIAGTGDFYMSQVTVLEDPCPLPDKEKRAGTKTSLSDKEVKLYAPMCNVGNVMFDDDAVYINVENPVHTRDEFVVDDAKKGFGGGEDDDSDDDSDSDSDSDEDEDGHGAWDGGGAKARRPVTEGMAMIRNMQDMGADDGLDDGLGGQELSLFAGSAPVRAGDVASSSSEEEDEEDSDDDDDDDEMEQQEEGGSQVRRLVDAYSDDDDDDDDDDVSDVSSVSDHSSDEEDGAAAGVGERWKENLAERAADAFHSRENDAFDLMGLVYGDPDAPKRAISDSKDAANMKLQQAADEGGGDDDDDDDFFTLKSAVAASSSSGGAKGGGAGDAGIDVLDCSRPFTASVAAATAAAGGEGHAGPFGDWSDIKTLENIRHRFVTGGKRAWGEQGAFDDAEGSDSGSDGGGGGGSSDGSEAMGGFEDLETGEVFGGGAADADDAGAWDGGGSNPPPPNETDAEMRERLAKEKASRKKGFDADYDAEKDQGGDKAAAAKWGEDAEASEVIEQAKRLNASQKDRNEAAFGGKGEAHRLLHEGVRNGIYVRIEVEGVPSEFVRHFDAKRPVLLGGLLPHEHQMGFMQIRFKRHRWHKRVLKTHDPLIFSVGWRRFQSLPLFSTEDQNGRQRYLKYTPEHMHCFATIYGPVCPPNTGVLAFQYLSNKETGFRVAGTGTALEVHQGFQVVKKLKLVGHPVKIFRNTAFIDGMFNSDLEVAKFNGASMKTVSGIRGSLKKAHGAKGQFRATFEDKVLMSDIVFCRTWVPVAPKEFYTPVCSSLQAADETWQGMKTMAQLRYEKNVQIPVQADSLYQPIERKTRRFNSAPVPKKLQEALPFASKPKVASKRRAPTYLAKRAVVMEPEERKKHTMLQMVNTVRNDKLRIQREKQKERTAKLQKKRAAVEAFFKPHHNEERKRKFATESKEQVRRAEKLSRTGGGKRGD